MVILSQDEYRSRIMKSNHIFLDGNDISVTRQSEIYLKASLGTNYQESLVHNYISILIQNMKIKNPLY